MDTNMVVQNAVATPFGWLIAGQGSFDLDSMLAFTKQLASLSRGLGKSSPIVETAADHDCCASLVRSRKVAG